DEVRNGLIGRVERRLPLPFHAEKLLKNTGIVFDNGPIAETALTPGMERNLANAAAGLLGPDTTGKLIDALPDMRAQLKLSPPPLTNDEYFRVQGLVSLTPVESFVTAVLRRAATSDPKEIDHLADLIARHGESGNRGRLELGGDMRQA